MNRYSDFLALVGHATMKTRDLVRTLQATPASICRWRKWEAAGKTPCVKVPALKMLAESLGISRNTLWRQRRSGKSAEVIKAERTVFNHWHKCLECKDSWECKQALNPSESRDCATGRDSVCLGCLDKMCNAPPTEYEMREVPGSIRGAYNTTHGT